MRTAVVLSLLLGAHLLGAGAAAAQHAPVPALSIPVEPGGRVDAPSPRYRGGGASARAIPVEEEREPPDASGLNDAPATAELLAGLGTGPDDHDALDLTGHLYAPAPEPIGPFAEDDGSIPLASETGLTPGRRVRAEAIIGDGLFGSAGAGSGDFDVFRIGGVRAGQRITVDIDTPVGAGGLDTKVALYDSTGRIVALNDNADEANRDSFLEVVVPAAGSYFVLVRGAHSFWPSDPFDSASGPKAGSEGPYRVTIGLDASDVDYFGIELEAGDVVGVRLEGDPLRINLYGPQGRLYVGSGHDASFLLPEGTPLPGGGGPALYLVAPAAGRYALRVAHGDGAYTLGLRVLRPALEGTGAVQILFVDFDGAALDASALFRDGHEQAVLSPLHAFLAPLGLDPTPGGPDERALVEAVMARVVRKVREDVRVRGPNPVFDVVLEHSLDHPDRFGAPGVSRIVVGGTRAELGLETIATAESVDVGNFAPEETAVVLLDVLLGDASLPNALIRLRRAPGVPLIDVLAAGIGDVVAHEIGHLGGSFHTGTDPSAPNLMDQGSTMAEFLGLGPDETFGTDDDVDVTFGEASYLPREGFEGTQDTRATLAFAFAGAPPVATEEGEEGESAFTLSAIHPNPFGAEARVVLHVAHPQRVRAEVFDLLGRRVRLLFDGRVPAGAAHVLALDGRGLPAGPYLVRIAGETFSATRTALRLP